LCSAGPSPRAPEFALRSLDAPADLDFLSRRQQRASSDFPQVDAHKVMSHSGQRRQSFATLSSRLIAGLGRVETDKLMEGHHSAGFLTLIGSLGRLRAHHSG
jgi:hypothetical protein